VQIEGEASSDGERENEMRQTGAEGKTR